jgi:uncharacterized membrane protein YphA (DoxX/SURF4 family)
VSQHWASGGPRSPVRDGKATAPIAPKPPDPPEPTTPQREPTTPQPAATAQPATTTQPRLHAIAERTAVLTADWAPTAGRILLGVVFAWFGYHELLQPGQWTQYVPAVSESSSLAIVLVLAHGWVLLVLAAALVAGIAPRAAAAIASVLMLEIVISLAVTGLSDTALRDVGVLGLAVCLAGSKNQRLVLRT